MIIQWIAAAFTAAGVIAYGRKEILLGAALQIVGCTIWALVAASEGMVALMMLNFFLLIVNAHNIIREIL